MRDNLVVLKEIIRLDELADRWGEKSGAGISLFLFDNEARYYKFYEKRISPDGEVLYLCIRSTSNGQEYCDKLQEHNQPFYMDSIVYEKSTIDEIEKAHPELLWEVETYNDIRDKLLEEKARERIEFDIAEGGGHLESYEESQILNQIYELEKEIDELKSQLPIDNCSVKYVGRGGCSKETAQSEPKLTSQQKAALAKQEKTLEGWKPAIDAMIKVAVRCGEEGNKLRQKTDFYAMFNELDAELSDTQMEFFRKSLPDAHTDREGGTREKS